MQLACPNCEAEYEVPDGMVPAAGRHVQCTACHTRWFARGTAADAPSEDAILSRLEGRAPLRPARAGDPDAPAPEPATAAAVVQLRPAEPAPPPLPPRPAVPRPGEIATNAPAPRAAPRLDLDPPAAPVAAPVPAPPRSGRFGLGLAAALLLFLLALVGYDQRREIAAAYPPAAPAVEAYARSVDGLRDAAERGIAPLRARVAALLDRPA